MGIVDAADVESLLTKKYKEVMGDHIYAGYEPDKALLARDSLAKQVFKRVFDFICEKINTNLLNGYDPKKQKKSRFTGILDIFGFEIFELNSFEQLCINFTNEKLQWQFNNHMFSMEQAEYKKEKVPW